MARKLLIIGFIAFLILLSGCQTEQATRGPPEVESYPAGTNETTITDPGALLESHQAVIRTTGYVLEKSGESDGESWNTTFKSSVRDRRYLYSCTGKCFTDYGNSKFSYYQEGGNLFSMELPERGHPQQEAYSVYEPRDEFNKTHLRFGTPSITETLESNTTTKSDLFRRSGHTYIRYDVREPPNSNKTVNGSIVVREDGVITSYALDVFEPDGDHFRIRIRIRPSSGLQISPPEWKEKAEDAATIESEELTGGYTGSSCNNDGDQSYNEDNDRDNDGICDES